MLILARLDGVTRVVGGSLSPKNDGPLIKGGSLGTGAGTGTFRGVSVDACVCAVSGRVDGADPTPTAWGLFAGGAGASRVVPHIPQKRLSSGLSLPQRGQRTQSPDLIAYDILDVRCRPWLVQARSSRGAVNRK